MADVRYIARLLKQIKTLNSQATLYNDQTKLSDAKADLQMLIDEWEQYNTLEKSFSTDFVKEQKTIIEEFETVFYKTKQRILRSVKAIEEKESVSARANTSISQQTLMQDMALSKRDEEVRLPRLGIEPFTGVYSKFPTFRDCFSVSVHENESYSKVNKFKYLLSFLKDDALRLVSNMTITEENYDEAWDKLVKRYNKPKLIMADLIQQFFSLRTVNKASSSLLYQIADVTDEVVRGLKRVGSNAESRDPWLIYMILERLDDATKNAWGEYTTDKEFPTLQQLLDFLTRRAGSMEAAEKSKLYRPGTAILNKLKVHHALSNVVICVRCSKEHYLNLCPEFLNLPVQGRRNFASEKGLCYNCLSTNHRVITCKKKLRCNICHKRHHVTLHPTEMESKTPTEEASTSQLQACTTITTSFQSILPTAVVLVLDAFGRHQRCRVLLDCGSQASFISEACAQRLQLPRRKAKVLVSGIGRGKIITKGEISLQLFSLHKNSGIDINALIIHRLPSGVPAHRININSRELIQDITLADSDFHKSGDIDILIGADKFFNLLLDGKRYYKNNSIIAQNTIFGWIVAGNSETNNVKKGTHLQANFSVTNLNLEIDINKTLQRFWEIESVTSSPEKTIDENECEKVFISNFRKNNDGRYIVKLPFKDQAPALGDSIAIARKRLFANERKLHDGNHELLKKSYIDSMREYYSRGYLRTVSQTKDRIEDSDCCYLPHHAFLKESSETTKVRVVFDGSAKTSTGFSLNDTLMVGPTVQPTLWNILMRFRYNKIAVVADIEKMYNQVLVEDEHQRFQRILWRENPAEELKEYQLTTVTFGLASSSILATRALNQVALDNEHLYPDIVPHILNSFYVDDFLSGANTIEEARNLKEKIERILASGGFPLRKWRSNSPDAINDSNSSKSVFHDPSSETVYEEQRVSTNLAIAKVVNNGDNFLDELLAKVSSYNKLVRVIAYVARFLHNFQKNKIKISHQFLTTQELENSRNVIIKHVQQKEFADDIKNLKKKIPLEKRSYIRSLAPFLDDKGILRVGGRLKNANCETRKKYPIILPKSHNLGKIIISLIHQANLHPGPSLTFHLSRQEFWIIGGRSAARQHVRGCLTCFKANAKASQQLMGSLPSARVVPARPFSRCGVDYAGPINLSSKKGRGAKLIKSYLAIFICMVTKSIHIEVVSDLSTEAFIAALRRLCGRRGVPAEIYSDNGSNFIGAKRRLNEMYQLVSSKSFNDVIEQYLTLQRIEWHTIPPSSPHFGGLWEAAVKSVKGHITKYTSNCHLTFEEMSTLVCQIESILNSRPLYKTIDEDTIEALTPAHFLIGGSSYSIPEKEIDENISDGRLTRWQFIQRRTQSFWKKFQVEYLHNLQQRNKWQNTKENLKVDDIVLVKEDNLPVGQWALGRIIDIHPDSSGLVRIVTLRTAKKPNTSKANRQAL